jgi:N-methylhydantoinase B
MSNYFLLSDVDFPLIIWRKEFRDGSCGAGRYRGGLGQVLEFGCEDNAPFSIAAMFDRTWQAPKGRHGGHDCAVGVVRLESGALLKSKGRQTIPYNEHLVLEMPGGGGFGDPLVREPERILDDVLDGLITAKAAFEDYGVVLKDNMAVDHDATDAQREKLAKVLE